VRTFILSLFLIGLVAAGGFAAWLVIALGSAGPLAASKAIIIEQGTSTRGIATQLQNEEVIGSPLAFRILARIKGGLKAGEYQFVPGMTMGDVIALLQSGKTVQHRITIPEGLMSVEILALLQEEPVLTGAVEKIPEEGSLLPETYNFTHGDTRQELIERMQAAMKRELDMRWKDRAEGLPFSTPAEAVVLASVVEKETGVATERPRVAGVFLNRLAKGIPLQSDPTVIYALTLGQRKLDRLLTLKDLKTDSPYNTYMVPGLPPGPIANPGAASLNAVLHPEQNDYIYFVADGTGGHAFAKTLEEHNKNVAAWRKIQKQAK
jgi:UPF0755 protein